MKVKKHYKYLMICLSGDPVTLDVGYLCTRSNSYRYIRQQIRSFRKNGWKVLAFEDGEPIEESNIWGSFNLI